MSPYKALHICLQNLILFFYTYLLQLSHVHLSLVPISLGSHIWKDYHNYLFPIFLLIPHHPNLRYFSFYFTIF